MKIRYLGEQDMPNGKTVSLYNIIDPGGSNHGSTVTRETLRRLIRRMPPVRPGVPGYAAWTKARRGFFTP